MPTWRLEVISPPPKKRAFFVHFFFRPFFDFYRGFLLTMFLAMLWSLFFFEKSGAKLASCRNTKKTSSTGPETKKNHFFSQKPRKSCFPINQPVFFKKKWLYTCKKTPKIPLFFRHFSSFFEKTSFMRFWSFSMIFDDFCDCISRIYLRTSRSIAQKNVKNDPKMTIF